MLLSGAVLLAVAIGLTLFFALATETFTIPSEANAPTLKPGDHVLMLKGSSASRDELVVFHSPALYRRLVVMRVVAIGGDTVSQRGDVLYVNGRIAPRSYVPTDTTYSVRSTVVPVGSVYVLGDNRTNAFDSRAFGPLPDSDIVGHLAFCYWPLGRIGSL